MNVRNVLDVKRVKNRRALPVIREPKSKLRPVLSAGTKFEMLSLVKLTVKNVKAI